MTSTTVNLTNGADMSVGQKREDGTIYLGYHKDEEDGQMKDWFTPAEDAKDKGGERVMVNFNQAAECAKKFDAHGYNDWKVVTDNLMTAQFNARNTGAFADTYEHNTRSYPHSRYVSSSKQGDKVISRSFVTGEIQLLDLGFVSLARFARAEPRP